MAWHKLTRTLLWLSLLTALVGSLQHVAWAFATMEGNHVAGYVQAVAVDLGLVALSLGIHQRKRQRRNTNPLWIGVFVFAAISTYANTLHALESATPLANTPYWLAALRPVILGAALPLLVIYLTEILGDDLRHDAEGAERRERRERRQQKQQTQQPGRQGVDNTLLALVQANPHATLADLATALGVSKSTVSRAAKRLEKAGVLHKNGNGWEVRDGNQDA